MKYSATILFIVFALESSVCAQIGKSIYVTRDPRLDKLVEKHFELYKLAPSGKIVIEQGFRLLVISSNKRDLVMKVRADLLSQYPNEKTYLSYQSPNFKVHFGNFTTRSEAEKVRKELNLKLGISIVIVPAKIERVITNYDKMNHQ